MEQKRCTRCWTFKPISEFYLRGGTPIARCKPCVKEVNAKNRKRRLENDPTYRERYYEISNRARRTRNKRRWREDPEWRERQLEAERKCYHNRKADGRVWKRDRKPEAS